MRETSIQLHISLDENNVPEKIRWDATDKPEEGQTEIKSLSLAMWDQNEQSTMRIDLWVKDMPVDEMKRFYIDSIGGLSQSLLRATGDEYMAGEMNALCERLATHLRNSSNPQKAG